MSALCQKRTCDQDANSSVQRKAARPNQRILFCSPKHITTKRPLERMCADRMLPPSVPHRSAEYGVKFSSSSFEVRHLAEPSVRSSAGGSAVTKERSCLSTSSKSARGDFLKDRLIYPAVHVSSSGKCRSATASANIR